MHALILAVQVDACTAKGFRWNTRSHADQRHFIEQPSIVDTKAALR